MYFSRSVYSYLVVAIDQSVYTIFVDGPVYIIMEYAHHGNLKDYLERCKAELLQRNISIHVGTEKGKP